MTNFTLSMVRPHDLLVLEFEMVNLRPSADGTVLELIDAANDAFVVVHFPPQAISEATFVGAVDAPPIRTVLSGPTRLVFRVPPETTVPLTAAGVLNWDDWEPVLPPTAKPRGTLPDAGIPAPALPSPLETAVEFPWRLVLSPDSAGRWRPDNGATVAAPQQLWSAVLRVKAADPVTEELTRGTSAGADVRAIAAYTGVVIGSPPKGPPLTADNLNQIVHLTSDFHLPIPPEPETTFTPVPLQAKKLELTALGANAELEGKWEYPQVGPGAARPPGFVAFDLVKYQHTAAIGRDHFVRTVTVGFLCGTGHRAVVELTVERMPAGPAVVGHNPDGTALFGTKGYLLKTAIVTILQPVVDYRPLAGAFAHDGREFPFQNIRITTRSAPISVPNLDGGPFWLLDPAGKKLLLQAVGTDVAGNTVEFPLPALFVRGTDIDKHLLIRQRFQSAPEAKTLNIGRQQLTVAPAAKPGSTVLTVDTLTYDIEQPRFPGNPVLGHLMNSAAAPKSYVPRFLPRIDSMMATAPAVDDLLGTSRPVSLGFDKVYLSQGFDTANNRAQTFVSFTQPLPLALPTQRGGGLASPASAAQALSRTVGPVSAPDQLQLGQVDLSAFATTKILGTIPLLDLISAPDLGFDAAAAGSPPSQALLDDPLGIVNPPRLTSRRSPEVGIPDVVETRFVWKPPLRTKDVSSVFRLEVTRGALLLDATTRLVRGGEASSLVVGTLRGAELIFADALRAKIGLLHFRAEGGRKIEIGAKDVTITFEGPLAFVNSLQSILPADGFDDPPFLTVDSQGVVAGYTLGVPNIGVGIFSIQNIGLSAALSIPFTDRPVGVRFAVSERHKPFLVTVSLFGGGGFFAVGVSTKGIEEVEASIEFGGNISINLGLASGGVSVMAGIYFGMKGDIVELTGYLRCGGYLEVLGLISISLEFYLAFTYRKKGVKGSEVWGQASLTVSVKVAFISTSVTLSVERRFAGADGDPSFAQSVTAPAWAGYLQAFA